MKKILSLLTGIVALITILLAAGCSKTGDSEGPEDSPKVKIYLKAIEEDGEMHLKMYDSNKPEDKVIDELETLVPPGSTVIWKRTLSSGIKRIDKIGSKSGDGNIFKGDAQPIPNTKRFKLEIPEDVSSGEEEAYYIKFEDKDGKLHEIDPYLRIP